VSVILLPSGFKPRSCSFSLAVNQRVYASVFGGAEQAVDLLNDRWTVTCELAGRSHAAGAEIEAFIAAMRGQVNTCSLWHFTRPQPRGTARGTMVLNAAAAQGASSISVSGVSPANGTLLAGDILGVGGQLLMVASDCVAAGGIVTIQIVNRLRAALSSSAAVTWDKPTASFRLLSSEGVTYSPRLAATASLDFAEAL
jgi:hypothetical protein